jgi:hypothetical protein
MPTTRWVTGRAGSGWWRRLHNGSEEQLDDNHLMRMAGRFARRVKAWGAASGIPVIYCKSGERKHRIAEEYLATHDIVKPGVFLVLAAKAPATIWQVRRSANGVIGNLATKYSYVNHYSFHIMDPQWGHVTIKMSGHPPVAAQVMLNGHEFVACQARARPSGNKVWDFCGRWTGKALSKIMDRASDLRKRGGRSGFRTPDLFGVNDNQGVLKHGRK